MVNKPYTSQLRALKRILNKGYYTRMALRGEIEKANEPRIRLWRAVVDQHIKDIILFYLVNDVEISLVETRLFFKENFNGVGQEVELAHLDEEKVNKLARRLDLVCRKLKKKGQLL